MSLSSNVVWRTDQPEQFHLLYETFDVRKAKEIIQATPREVDTILSADLASWIGTPGKITMGVVIQWQKALSDEIDLTVPVILVCMKGGLFPIDGWHRIAKAVHTNVPELPAVALSEEESYLVGAPHEKEVRKRNKNNGVAKKRSGKVK